MARRAEGESRKNGREISRLSREELERIESLTKFELIEEIARKGARIPISNEESLYAFLRYWWSQEYNRPYNDPILSTYTLEELALEYYDKSERAIIAEERRGQNGDKIEEQKVKDALDWAEQEEQREIAEAAEKAAAVDQPYKPSPEEEEWMRKQFQTKVEEINGEHGEGFGDDIVGSFEDEE